MAKYAVIAARWSGNSAPVWVASGETMQKGLILVADQDGHKAGSVLVPVVDTEHGLVMPGHSELGTKCGLNLSPQDPDDTKAESAIRVHLGIDN